MSGLGTKGPEINGPEIRGVSMRRALKSGLLIAGLAGVSASLAGCVDLGGGKAPDRLIRLTPETSLAAGAGQSGRAGGAILVVEPQTDRALAVSRVAVQVDETRIAYLPDVGFVERPARQFRGVLAEALRVKGTGIVLEDDQPAPSGARRLSGRLLMMGYDARSHAVVVRFDALWQAGDGTLASRRFEAVEPGISPRAAAVAPALNRAANAVAGQVAAWVTQ